MVSCEDARIHDVVIVVDRVRRRHAIAERDQSPQRVVAPEVEVRDLILRRPVIDLADRRLLRVSELCHQRRLIGLGAFNHREQLAPDVTHVHCHRLASLR